MSDRPPDLAPHVPCWASTTESLVLLIYGLLRAVVASVTIRWQIHAMAAEHCTDAAGDDAQLAPPCVGVRSFSGCALCGTHRVFQLGLKVLQHLLFVVCHPTPLLSTYRYVACCQDSPPCQARLSEA
jgi:hypothetical protein